MAYPPRPELASLDPRANPHALSEEQEHALLKSMAQLRASRVKEQSGEEEVARYQSMKNRRSAPGALGLGSMLSYIAGSVGENRAAQGLEKARLASAAAEGAEMQESLRRQKFSEAAAQEEARLTGAHRANQDALSIWGEEVDIENERLKRDATLQAALAKAAGSKGLTRDQTLKWTKEETEKISAVNTSTRYLNDLYDTIRPYLERGEKIPYLDKETMDKFVAYGDTVLESGGVTGGGAAGMVPILRSTTTLPADVAEKLGVADNPEAQKIMASLLRFTNAEVLRLSGQDAAKNVYENVRTALGIGPGWSASTMIHSMNKYAEEYRKQQNDILKVMPAEVKDELYNARQWEGFEQVTDFGALAEAGKTTPEALDAGDRPVQEILESSQMRVGDLHAAQERARQEATGNAMMTPEQVEERASKIVDNVATGADAGARQAIESILGDEIEALKLRRDAARTRREAREDQSEYELESLLKQSRAAADEGKSLATKEGPIKLGRATVKGYLDKSLTFLEGVGKNPSPADLERLDETLFELDEAYQNGVIDKKTLEYGFRRAGTAAGWRDSQVNTLVKNRLAFADRNK